MKASIPSVKGTRDFYPEDMAIRSWLYQKIRAVSQSFGYQEYDGPFLEKLELYAAKSGEELVKEQSFVFPDRGGEMLTLRPELTPSLARMVAQRQKELVYPLRWWSFGPFWRYERPQKGRTREFFQWNIDLIGPNSPESDAELIAVCARFFESVGLSSDQVEILVNNRRLMEDQLGRLGIPAEQRADVFRLIDRQDKMRADEWARYAEEIGLTKEQFDGLCRLLENENLWQESEELRRLFAALEAIGVSDYVAFEPKIIRGLDYYTGTVFEGRDKGREGRAVLGGGHYDNLVADVGGEPLSAVGFAMGDVMITLVLEKYGLLPEIPPTPAPVLVTVFDAELLISSMKLASELRKAGINAVCFTEPVKLNKQLKYADRMGMRIVVIVGPDEQDAGQATVKDLVNRQQLTVDQSEVAKTIGQMLAAHREL